ncbi:MAG: hypothetical protein ACE5HM_06885 [Acidiferrobacterales bacterium]
MTTSTGGATEYDLSKAASSAPLLDAIVLSLQGADTATNAHDARFHPVHVPFAAEYASWRDTKDATAGKHDSVSSLNQALTTGAADR